MTPAAPASGTDIAAEDVLRFLLRRGRLRGVAVEALAEEVAVRAAREAGLAVSDGELQQAANRFRQRHGLATPDKTHGWLAAQGMSVEDFEAGLEYELLTEKFKDHLAADRSADHFAAHRSRYARADLRQIVVATDGVAREFLARVADEGCDFAELAREHSLHPSRRTGGSLGSVPRHALPDAIAAAVFASAPGAVAGPFGTDQGFHLFLIEGLTDPALDEVTAAAVREDVFAAWLRDRLRDVRLDLSGLQSR